MVSQVPARGLALPDGRFIPAGIKVGINPSVTNRDHQVFGDDADGFNPDRWLRRAGESEAGFDARVRTMRDVADHVFGGGTRVCMGRYFAQLELWKLFATLYSMFDVSCSQVFADAPSGDNSLCLRSSLSTRIIDGNTMMRGSCISGIYQWSSVAGNTETERLGFYMPWIWLPWA